MDYEFFGLRSIGSLTLKYGPLKVEFFSPPKTEKSIEILKEFSGFSPNSLRISMDFSVFGGEKKSTLSGPYFKVRDPIDPSPKNSCFS